jgi:D-threo-aldose 1-dehydrogenase
MKYVSLGSTDVKIPPIIFGTSCLGNLYQALSFETKLNIVREMIEHVEQPVLDTAGKYGAGLALNVIGDALRELGIAPQNVSISNKLGWQRIPLTTPEPTFEPGAWADLKFDAEQNISYDGILRCYEQGVKLLGDEYAPQVLSVHDPDEYIAAAPAGEKEKALDDILDAYRALFELKENGRAKAIGVGAKDWRVIQKIDATMDLDWIMLAVSYTIFSHPPELLEFIDHLQNKGVTVINSAVFHAGFLTGGTYFDYRILDANNPQDQHYFSWRSSFFQLCKKYDILPATACVQFAMSHPGVASIALNTSNPKRIKQNIDSVLAVVPAQFWSEMKEQKLIDENYPHMNILEAGT